MKKTVFFLLLVFLSACGSAPDFTPLTENATILAFGDSLTFGYGARDKNDSYPAVLQQLSGHRVINAGISGEETDAGLKRLPQLLKEHQPELLIIMHGGNDILRNRNPNRTKNNLEKMIRLARKADSQILLVGVPRKNLFSSSAPLYAELAETFDLVFEEDLLSDMLRKPAMKSDQIHLNAEGYRRFAEQIMVLLRDKNAL